MFQCRSHFRRFLGFLSRNCPSKMEETKIIYHIDDEDTPYLVKLPIPSDVVTLGDFKNVLNRPNYKFFFKSMDDDFGQVFYLPFKRGRVSDIKHRFLMEKISIFWCVFVPYLFVKERGRKIADVFILSGYFSGIINTNSFSSVDGFPWLLPRLHNSPSFKQGYGFSILQVKPEMLACISLRGDCCPKLGDYSYF